MAGNEAPPFWYREPGLQARLLAPLAWGYGRLALRRMDRARPSAVAAPVLCVGNLTVGGTGKTPTALAIAEAVSARGLRPGFVSRGYGGTHARTHIVDAENDIARSVGDEALLLARAAPTAIGADRARSARALIDAGANFIIMDDGFQSRSVHIDHALITIDARRGIGNGRVIPAGPLRAPLRDQMRLADQVICIGEGAAAGRAVRVAAQAAKPILHAALVPQKPKGLRHKRVLAYCGIGDPNKFFSSVEELGLRIIARRSFGDHHMFTEQDARSLLAAAEDDRLGLVTTHKDQVRLSYSEGPLAELRALSHAVPVRLVFESAASLAAIIDATLAGYRERRVNGR
ncbi:MULTISPECIES: tetraacyldisaccharide 4'-kinase [unclassified Roseitalea]|uniref:tetraacyldisaccharide 4'-kinase n=1 Tax=unclassified Roseitalea TaxID=2639107 RepID=UPI00273FEF40|nr:MULTISPECIES: tetraacyldisaccharide 4'-kinase [unclassified Roseitalea]